MGKTPQPSNASNPEASQSNPNALGARPVTTTAWLSAALIYSGSLPHTCQRLQSMDTLHDAMLQLTRAGQLRQHCGTSFQVGLLASDPARPILPTQTAASFRGVTAKVAGNGQLAPPLPHPCSCRALDLEAQEQSLHPLQTPPALAKVEAGKGE